MIQYMLEYAKELERIVWPGRYQMKNAFLYIVLFVLFIHSDWCKLKDLNTILTTVRLCYCLNCFLLCFTTPLQVCLCTGNSSLNYISISWMSSWNWHLKLIPMVYIAFPWLSKERCFSMPAFLSFFSPVKNIFFWSTKVSLAFHPMEVHLAPL